MLMGVGIMGADLGQYWGATAKYGFYIVGTVVTSIGYGMNVIPLLPEIHNAIEKNLTAKNLVAN